MKRIKARKRPEPDFKIKSEFIVPISGRYRRCAMRARRFER